MKEFFERYVLPTFVRTGAEAVLDAAIEGIAGMTDAQRDALFEAWRARIAEERAYNAPEWTEEERARHQRRVSAFERLTRILEVRARERSRGVS